MTFALRFVIASLVVAGCQVVAQDSSKPQNLLQRSNGQIGIVPGSYPLYVLMKDQKIIKEIGLTREKQAEWNQIYLKLDAARTADMKAIKDQQFAMLTELMRLKGQVSKETYDKTEGELAQVESEVKARQTEGASIIDKRLAKFLTGEQTKRLEQIRLQAEGPKAFDRPELQAALGLEPEQIETIADIQAAYNVQLRSAGVLKKATATNTEKSKDSEVAAAIEVKSAQSRMSGVRVESMKAVERILTKAQRKAYLIKIGEPFDFLGNRDTDDAKGKSDDRNIKEQKGSGAEKHDHLPDRLLTPF